MLFQANGSAISVKNHNSGHTNPRSESRNRPQGSSIQAVPVNPGRDARAKPRLATQVLGAFRPSKTSYSRSSSAQGQATKNVRRPRKLPYDNESPISISDSSSSEIKFPSPPNPQASRPSRGDGPEEPGDMSDSVGRHDTTPQRSPITQGEATRNPGKQNISVNIFQKFMFA